jgi:hypothetical protein
MDQQNEALLHLFAAAGLGFAHQWLLFGPAKVKPWIAWASLAFCTLALYWWATPSFVADFAANWRLSIVGVVSFFLTAKGTGSSAAAAKAAPKSNSL